MKNAINFIFFLAFMAFMAFMAIVMVEWVSGCGQTYIDAQGVEHIAQCWIIGGGK
jgi:hypothetical protein